MNAIRPKSSLAIGQDNSNLDVVVFPNVERGNSRSRVRDINNAAPKAGSDVFVSEQIDHTAKLGDRRHLRVEDLQLAIGFSGGEIRRVIPHHLATSCDHENDDRDNCRHQRKANSGKYDEFVDS